MNEFVYQLVLFTHVMGAVVLIGTGAGIAWFMLQAHQTDDPAIIAHTAGRVVVADAIFTLPTVLIQPITGVLLAWHIGWPLMQGWVFASILLYIFIGIFWLPVVVIQIRLRDLAQMAVEERTQLPTAYYRLYRIWFACGFPAFAAILIIVWLMLTKPDLAIGLPI